MATGISIHIGLNRVNPSHYQGWDGKLKGCENDAHAMEAIASKQKFATSLLLNEQATAESVKAAIAGAAGKLKAATSCSSPYSGHGGQVPDPTEEGEEGYDETWVLYDRQLIDDELYALWGQFESGVRIFMLSDSCHSGTSLARDFLASPLFAGVPATNLPVPRANADGGPRPHLRGKQGALRPARGGQPQGDRVGIGASVILISGCQDNQVSQDGPKNGVFTGALLRRGTRESSRAASGNSTRISWRRSSSSRAPTCSKSGIRIRRLSGSGRSRSEGVNG